LCDSATVGTPGTVVMPPTPRRNSDISAGIVEEDLFRRRRVQPEDPCTPRRAFPHQRLYKRDIEPAAKNVRPQERYGSWGKGASHTLCPITLRQVSSCPMRMKKREIEGGERRGDALPPGVRNTPGGGVVQVGRVEGVIFVVNREKIGRGGRG